MTSKLLLTRGRASLPNNLLSAFSCFFFCLPKMTAVTPPCCLACLLFSLLAEAVQSHSLQANPRLGSLASDVYSLCSTRLASNPALIRSIRSLARNSSTRVTGIHATSFRALAESCLSQTRLLKKNSCSLCYETCVRFKLLKNPVKPQAHYNISTSASFRAEQS
jgi:hypothetical protein